MLVWGRDDTWVTLPQGSLALPALPAGTSGMKWDSTSSARGEQFSRVSLPAGFSLEPAAALMALNNEQLLLQP